MAVSSRCFREDMLTADGQDIDSDVYGAVLRRVDSAKFRGPICEFVRFASLPSIVTTRMDQLDQAWQPGGVTLRLRNGD